MIGLLITRCKHLHSAGHVKVGVPLRVEAWKSTHPSEPPHLRAWHLLAAMPPPFWVRHEDQRSQQVKGVSLAPGLMCSLYRVILVGKVGWWNLMQRLACYFADLGELVTGVCSDQRTYWGR